MPTIREHFMTLPEPYRTQALANSRPISLEAPRRTLANALQSGFSWAASPQGHKYWQNIWENPAKALLANPERRERHSQQTPQTMDKYSTQPVAQVTLVFGTDVSEMSAATCIATIKANQSLIKDFVDTGIESPYIEKQIAGLTAANAELVKRLDSLA
jgi:hypothetical protein